MLLQYSNPVGKIPASNRCQPGDMSTAATYKLDLSKQEKIYIKGGDINEEVNNTLSSSHDDAVGFLS